jgi:hypothetical protein
MIAVCVVIVGSMIFGGPGKDGKFVSDIFLVEDIESFSRQADQQGTQAALVENMKRHGFVDVKFSAKTSKEGHQISPLGIRYVTFKKKRVAQVLFECCGKPVVVLVAPKELPMHETPIRFANEAKGTVQQKAIGNFRIIAGAQDHAPDEALELFASINTDSADVH